MKLITRYPYVVIILLFLFSVLVRVPNLNRPLSKHHEFCTATCLRTMQIWDEAGITTYNFNPIMTYPGFANKYINNQTGNNFDKNGDDYYKSYPPGAYLLPFFIFHILHIYPDVLPLQIYNLLLHLFECIFLYNIVLLFAGKENRKEFQLVGLLTVVFQFFNHCALWFHGNSYMTDMQASTFFVVCIYLFFKIIINNNFSSPRWLLLLGLSNFVLNYSEYIGVTFTTIACLYCFIKAFRNRQFIFPLFVIGLSCLTAITLTIYQYSLINGFQHVTEFITYRYTYQSGYAHGENHFALIKGLVQNYITGLLPELLFISMSIILLATNKRLNDFIRIAGHYSILILLIYLPVLLHHLIFLNASQYDFHVLKATPAVSLLCAALFYFIYKNDFFSYLQEYRNTVFVMAIGIISILNIIVYYSINLPGKISVSGQSYEREKVAGIYISEQASPDEVIFIKGFKDEPQTILYAHRDMRTIKTDEDADNFLKTYHRSKGVIFILDQRGFVTTEKHISI